MAGLEHLLKLQGITVQYKFRSGSSEIQGISFGKDGCLFKGSEIDRGFSYSKLMHTMEKQQEQQTMALQKHRQMVTELRHVARDHRHHSSLLGTLLRQENAGGMPVIAPDEDDRKYRKRKKKKGISR